MGLTIDLYCPFVDKTKSKFGIGPFKKPDDVLQDIRSLFGIGYAAIYDIRGEPIDDICACKPGDIVQVAGEHGEMMQRYAPRNCIFYNGEQMEDITYEWSDGYGLPWKELNDSQRCEHIMSLDAKPEGFILENTIRITRPYVEVQQELKDIAAAAPEDMDTKANLGMAIFSNWAWKWEILLLPSMKPVNVEDMSTKVLGLLVVLSSFTHGSARKVRTYLVEAINARHPEEGEKHDAVLRAQDVVHVISALYDKAGSLAAKIALAKEKKMKDKMKEKARKKAWQMRKKAEKKNHAPSDVDDLADQLDDV